MEEQVTVLCASSAYEKKYYLNEEFNGFTEDVGGILTILFDEDGYLTLRPEKDEDDVLYDDIGCGLKIRQLELEKQELFEQLENYYKVFIRREDNM